MSLPNPHITKDSKDVEHHSQGVHASIYEGVRHDQPRFSYQARRAVLAKGFCDVLLALTVIVFPSLSYAEILAKTISKLTGLEFVPWRQDPTLGALIMGCAFAAFTAGQTESDDAFRVIAALNGSFAVTGLILCALLPRLANSLLLLVALQDVCWFFVIQRAGGYGVLDSLGISSRCVNVLEEKLSREVIRRKAKMEQSKARGSTASQEGHHIRDQAEKSGF